MYKEIALFKTIYIFSYHQFRMARKKIRTRKKPTAPTGTSVQRKRKQWSDTDMIKALEEVAKGKNIY